MTHRKAKTTAPVVDSTAGAGRPVADADRDAKFVGQCLQFAFPEPYAIAVGAAAIGGDQQLCGVGVARRAKVVPPAPDACDGEGGGIVADADVDPSLIGGD